MKRSCIQCSVEFKTKPVWDYIYCSMDCAAKQANTVHCLICSISYKEKVYRNGHRTGKYCSAKCSNKGGKEIHVCGFCKKEFIARLSGKSRKEFCSTGCLFNSKRAFLVCYECGKDFVVPANKSGQIYCSAGCATDSLKNRVSLRCSTCGQEYEVKSSRSDGSRHCSLKCLNLSKEIRRDFPEPSPINGARWIQLGHGKFSLIDEEDFERVSKFRWSEYKGYAYRMDSSGREYVSLHRFILESSPDDLEIDHKNTDRLDNRKSNLRYATRSQNAMNKYKRKERSIKYRGVSINSKGHIIATICKDMKTTHLGTFKNEEDAARAYDDAAREDFGEFARLNFPGPGERQA